MTKSSSRAADSPRLKSRNVMNVDDTRRALLTVAGAGALLAACRRETHVEPEDRATASAASPLPKPGGKPVEVGATEDLMREHGVIRRILVVYRVTAQHLRAKSAVSLEPLHRAATLLRNFGEEYHEKQLEEAQLFPAVKRVGGPAAAEVDILAAQHQRGREITEYVLAVAKEGPGGDAEPLARTLESFALMYEEHAAREDTIVFPAWKNRLSPKELDEMAERFEDIEHKTFGKDGFEDAVEQIRAIELLLGLENAALTAPPPPKV